VNLAAGLEAAYWTLVHVRELRPPRSDFWKGNATASGPRNVLLVGLTLLGLTHGACARVQSHYTLPKMAAADPSSLPMSGPVHRDPLGDVQAGARAVWRAPAPHRRRSRPTRARSSNDLAPQAGWDADLV